MSVRPIFTIPTKGLSKNTVNDRNSQGGFAIFYFKTGQNLGNNKE